MIKGYADKSFTIKGYADKMIKLIYGYAFSFSIFNFQFSIVNCFGADNADYGAGKCEQRIFVDQISC